MLPGLGFFQELHLPLPLIVPPMNALCLSVTGNWHSRSHLQGTRSYQTATAASEYILKCMEYLLLVGSNALPQNLSVFKLIAF